jgi:hypothetical protein
MAWQRSAAAPPPPKNKDPALQARGLRAHTVSARPELVQGARCRAAALPPPRGTGLSEQGATLNDGLHSVFFPCENSFSEAGWCPLSSL